MFNITKMVLRHKAISCMYMYMEIVNVIYFFQTIVFVASVLLDPDKRLSGVTIVMDGNIAVVIQVPVHSFTNQITFSMIFHWIIWHTYTYTYIVYFQASLESSIIADGSRKTLILNGHTRPAILRQPLSIFRWQLWMITTIVWYIYDLYIDKTYNMHYWQW